jgi:uncharacterized phage protein gp47/JayE
MAISTVPAPVLDTRDGDAVTAEAISNLPTELSDRSDSNPAVVMIEAQGTFFDKLLFQINQWPSSVIQKCLSLIGITLTAAAKSTVTQTFTLAAPQANDTTIAEGTQVSITDGSIVFETLTDLIIPAYTTPTGTISMTSGSPTVTGSGTSFPTDGSWTGYQLQAVNGTWYTVSSVGGATTLTLTSNALSTLSGASFNVGPISGTVQAQSTTTGVSTKVAAATLTTLVSSPAGVSSTTNAAAATGGADAETVAAAIERAPTAFAARDNACSVEDYAYFAQEILGEGARVKAKENYNNATSTNGYVTVAVLSPTWTAALSASAADRASVIRDLAGRQFTSSTTIDIAATIDTRTGTGTTPAAVVYRKSAYDETSVKINAAGAVNSYYSPNTYDWGRDLLIADLADVIEGAAGVDRVHTINGRLCAGFDWRTNTATMVVTNGLATITSVDAGDHSVMTDGQTILVDLTNKVAYLVTTKGATITLASNWTGASATRAIGTIGFFTSANDTYDTSTEWMKLPYASLGTTIAAAPASIVVIGSV